jgi:hypothetical protein
MIASGRSATRTRFLTATVFKSMKIKIRLNNLSKVIDCKGSVLSWSVFFEPKARLEWNCISLQASWKWKYYRFSRVPEIRPLRAGRASVLLPNG